MKEMGWKKIIILIILAGLDVFVIALPYYIRNFIPNTYTKLHVDEATFTQMAAIVGWVTLITQLPGGWLADKFSVKKLLIIGVSLTIVGAVWFALLILYGGSIEKTPLLNYQYYAIYALWGVSTTPFFWTPLWKLVSQQAKGKDQALAYSLQGGFNGLMGVIFTGIGGVIVLSIIQGVEAGVDNTNTEAIKAVNAKTSAIFAGYIFAFSGFLLILLLGLIFLVKEKESQDKSSLEWKTIVKVISDWKVWALSVLLLGMYMFQSTFTYYLNQLMVNTLGASLSIPALTFTILAALRIYGLRMAMSSVLAKLSDGFRSFVLLLVMTTGVGVILVLTFMFIPGFNGSYITYSTPVMWILFIVMNVLFFMIVSCSWIMVTLRYAQQGEIKIPKKTYGTITAILSFVGFSSDAWMFQISTPIVSSFKREIPNALAGHGQYFNYTASSAGPTFTYTDPTAYQIIIAIGAVIAIIGLLAGLAVYISNARFNSRYNLTFHRWRKLEND
ncbi:MFS transporter [Mycoplasma sp. NEAQ87857]|uniref:MFS transporter n=1 Tax=Mycoplasma sp. NEAQ87857 TaxID=2683967 RepID=UPI001318B126|nr:MFS transporter [Mycoplasma sp. NEAQ87857]QGZ97906.1 MFS transporter [Mycoplasma sp. NEAQ87857]